MDPQHNASEHDSDREQLAALTSRLESKEHAQRLQAAIRLGELEAGDAESLLVLERAAAGKRLGKRLGGWLD